MLSKNEIIEKLFTGKNFNDFLLKMDPECLREDLKQEIILIICELPEQKIIQLHNDKGLEFFTVRIGLNLIKSSTSPFAKKYRQGVQQYIEHEYIEESQNLINRETANRAAMAVYSEIDYEERHLREMIEDIAIEEVDKLYWYNKGLIQLYLKHSNYRAIHKETGIPFASCYKTIKKSFNEIKHKMQSL